jgi:hypothetical protein
VWTSPWGDFVRDVILAWWPAAVVAAELHDDVKNALDPHGRGRQYIVSRLEKIAGARMAGFVLTRQRAAGKWGVATYALRQTSADHDHRDHRGHRSSELPGFPNAPYDPYAPYAHGEESGKGGIAHPADPSTAPAAESTKPWRARL